MDPLLFGIEVDVVGEVLLVVILFSLLIERALSPIFEWRKYIEFVEKRGSRKGTKEPIALLVSLAVVAFYDFDAMAIILKEESSSWIGWLITAGIIAGGSKGSIKLFRDFLGWKSLAQEQYEAKHRPTTA